MSTTISLGTCHTQYALRNNESLIKAREKVQTCVVLIKGQFRAKASAKRKVSYSAGKAGAKTVQV